MDPVEDKSDPNKSKRTFVLGVVNISGIKSTSVNRKRRWDQPPKEGDEDDCSAPSKIPAYEPATSQTSEVERESAEDAQDVFFDSSDAPLEDMLADGDEKIPVVQLDNPSSDAINKESAGGMSEDLGGESKAASKPVVKKVVEEEVPLADKTASIDETHPKISDKKEKDTKSVAPVIISDSLKAIQFCYDEDDSSSQGSDNGESTSGPVVQADAVPKADEGQEPGGGGAVEQRSSSVISASAEPQRKVKSRSPTPVLGDEADDDPGMIVTGEDIVSSNVIQLHEDEPIDVASFGHDASHSNQLRKHGSDLAIESEPPDAAAVVDDTSQSCELDIQSSILLEKALPLDEAAVVEDTNQSNEFDVQGSDLVEKPVVTDIKSDLEISLDIGIQGEGIIESDLIEDTTAVVDHKPSDELSLDTGDQISSEEPRSPERANAQDVGVKGLEKLEDSVEKTYVDSVDTISENSAPSKTIREDSIVLSKQNQRTLISMDNSQNCCVSFDDTSDLDKNVSKSPELDLRYSDSDESNDKGETPQPEVTMHFASVRAQDSVSEETESPKDESALAIDALITANPDLSDKNLEEGEQTQTTMEMLDSLVRRSSEDDPSRQTLGGLFSEDSLINEINQLPDQDDDDDRKQEVSESAVEPVSDKPTVGDSVTEPKKPDIDRPDLIETNSTSPKRSSDDITNRQELEKTETRTSVEEELSQGGDDETKHVTVSSANIMEVIFGSDPKNSYPEPSPSEADKESEVDKKDTVEDKITLSQVDESVPVVSKKQGSDSKLQLNNEDFEMGSAEIVAVDPTKSLSGEDSEEEDVTSAVVEEEALKEKTQAPESKQIGDCSEILLAEGSSEKMEVEEPPKEVESKDNQKEKVSEEVSNESTEVQRPSAAIDEAPAKEAEVKSLSVPVGGSSKTTSVEKIGRSHDASKSAPGAEVKEPVPVLIIKKQSLPSKKEGEAAETLLTCSPKSTEGIGSPSRKPPSEILHVDTIPETSAEVSSSKHSPITLRIYKDNLTIKTDLDSPKRNKSPLSSEFKSELSPRPGVSDAAPQTKQLEFTLKIAKNANTTKATMSPKSVASPASVWKSEVQIADSPAPAKQDDVIDVKQVVSSRGRGRGSRGGTAKRTPAGRGRRGGGVAQKSILEGASTPDMDIGPVVVKQEPKDPSSPAAPLLGLQMTDAFKKMMSQESSSIPQIEPLAHKPPTGPETLTPVVKKRGRPRKSVQQVLPVPEELVHVKTETTEPTTPADTSGGETGDETPSGRPKRTCRGRTKPIVVKKRKRGGAAGSTVPRGTPTILPTDPADIKQEATPATPDLSASTATTTSSPEKTPAQTATPSRLTVCANGFRSYYMQYYVPGLLETADTEPPVPCHKCGAEMRKTTRKNSRQGETRPVLRCPRRGCQVYRFAGVTYELSEAARSRGNFKRPTPDRNTLSEKELAELQKIEAKKEKLRLDRIAKYEAKKAKKLAKKLKDEERRKRQAQEKADKAAAAAPQVFEEETRMSAPESGSRGHTPAPNRIILTGDAVGDESQNSTTTPGDSNRGNKKGRMEISIGDLDCLVKEVKVDDLAEYQWQGSELYMIQEQVSLYLGVKSFKRKYPGLKRRTVEAEERTFLEDSGLVPKSMCDLGITAVSSAEILDIMYQDFPEKYEEFRKHVRDKQAREASYKQRAAIGLQRKDGTKVEPREQALEAVAAWNANLNRERREERKCALDLQTFTVHYPKVHREHMAKPSSKVGMYPVAVIPGQFCDFYKKYTPTELMYFPINTVLYGPLKPNERQKYGSEDGSGSESSSSSSSSSSSGASSSESESEGEDPPKCTMCNGTRKKNKDSMPEVLLSCVLCKTCYHPSCKEFTPEMTPHLVKYDWQCTACKQCTKCRDPNLKDRIMCCQLCDRGYHLSCIGLKKMPEGRWHCSICAYCSSCDSRNPGGSDWQHEFKKGEKGTKVYQRTLCTPCFKLWRKGKYCQLCSKCHSLKPEEDPNLIQCNSCDRWLHKDCYGTKYGIQNKLLSTSSIQCDICVDRIQNSSISNLNRPLIKV